MDIRHYAALVWRWLWLLALGAIVAGGAAYYVSTTQTPVYQATTTLLISQNNSPGITDYSALLTGQTLARTYSQLITKRPVLEESAQRLGLPEIDVRAISVSVVRDTNLLVVSVEDTDPDAVARIVNTVAATFIAQQRDAALGETATYRDNLKKQLADIERDMKATSDRVDELRRSGGAQSEIANLQSLLTQYQGTYAQVLRADQDMRLAEAKATNAIRVAEPAEPSTVPVRPKTLQNTLLAALVGLMLAAGAAFLIEYLDDTVKSASEIEQAFGLATLGSIFRFHRTSKSGRIWAMADPRSSMAEAFRVLRTNLDFARISQPGKTLMVTSTGPGEGKTTTVANLGAMLAIAGRTVVVVDADLRRPKLHSLFEATNETGLTSLLLREDLQPEACLQATPVPGLRLLASGPVPPNPAELLASERMGRVVEQLADLADVVLFDSPPLLAVTDPVILGSRVAGVALVVDSGRTRHGALARAINSLERGSVPILGIVLNKIKARGAGGYYDYHYDHYGYGSSGDGRGKERKEAAGVPVAGDGAL